MPREITKFITDDSNKILTVKKVSSLGSGYMVFLPKAYVEIAGKLIDGSYWLLVEAKDGSITLKPWPEGEWAFLEDEENMNAP